MLEMKRREEVLKNHPYSIWEGKDGYWHTYLPCEDGTRRPVKRKLQKDVENIIIQFWESKNLHSFKARYEVWMERQKKCGRSDNTIYKYEKDYERFFKNDKFAEMRVQDITDECISEFILRLLKRKEVPYRALKAMCGYLNGVFEKCIMDNLITNNPCKRIDLPIYRQYCKASKPKIAEQRTLSESESKTLKNKLEKTCNSRPSYIPQYAVELSIYTGMRVGELSGLKWEDVDTVKKTLTICRSEKYNRKTKEYSCYKTYIKF